MSNTTSKPSFLKSRNFLGILFILLVAGITIAMSRTGYINEEATYVMLPAGQQDSIASKEAFKKVYTVLMHPRCLNCHPKGDVPLQGEDSHLHGMSPQRGKDGKGMFAMKCTNCHQNENSPGEHAPPGNPEWHLPPADMKMVFEGKSAPELAKQLTDKSKNGNKSIKELIEHADDTLVKAGWRPAEGLSKPPMSHKEFKKLWITWLKNGAYAPEASE
ncbi:c-type cytochrome [Flavimarina sp. Hel_I_48]|uniref:c-type cytochrome n=1 Tax=Flavimarina sp. Hel_I_48 TaxID=1392488 RepID=UPI0004DF6BE1|nr:c-type cytochrome [Flavimarina sp. Hel_I_48]